MGSHHLPSSPYRTILLRVVITNQQTDQNGVATVFRGDQGAHHPCHRLRPHHHPVRLPAADPLPWLHQEQPETLADQALLSFGAVEVLKGRERWTVHYEKDCKIPLGGRAAGGKSSIAYKRAPRQCEAS